MGEEVISIASSRLGFINPLTNRAVLRFNAFFGSSQRQPHTSFETDGCASKSSLSQVHEKGTAKRIHIHIESKWYTSQQHFLNLSLKDIFEAWEAVCYLLQPNCGRLFQDYAIVS